MGLAEEGCLSLFVGEASYSDKNVGGWKMNMSLLSFKG